MITKYKKSYFKKTYSKIRKTYFPKTYIFRNLSTIPPGKILTTKTLVECKTFNGDNYRQSL